MRTLIVMALLAAAVVVTNTTLVSVAQRTFDIGVRRAVGATLVSSYRPWQKGAAEQYLNLLGQTLAVFGDKPETFGGYHFLVLDTEEVNAFAAPGGYVVITRGLYRRLNSEADLAGVLAHEIGHVIRKHHLKLIQKQQLLSMGASVLGDSIGKESDTMQKLIGSGAEICARSWLMAPAASAASAGCTSARSSRPASRC